MKKGKLQCKDIPELPILQLLAKLEGKWATWYEDIGIMPSVRPAFPPDIPEKLIRAKMNSLIRTGFVDGCTCGCRGDYEITSFGKFFLSTI